MELVDSFINMAWLEECVPGLLVEVYVPDYVYYKVHTLQWWPCDVGAVRSQKFVASFLPDGDAIYP